MAWGDRQHEYERAATVEVRTGDRRDALDRALRVMRHRPSAADSGTVVEMHRDTVRRSSIGDVLVIEGEAYEIQDGGFKRI